jgi:DNA-binding CsgD family transcriptional regulator
MIEDTQILKQSIPDAAADAMTVLAPCAAWGFLSLAPRTDGSEICVSGGTASRDWHLRLLRAERARLGGVRQPRIDDAADSVEPFAHGLFVCVADGRKPYGVLSLLRTTDQGPFQSEERTVLERSVKTIAEWFALDEQRECDGAHEGSERPLGSPSVFIVDRDMRIESSAQASVEYDDVQRAFLVTVDGALSPPLARAVREVTARWGSTATECRAAITHPIPSLAVRVVPMLAGGHLLVCVLVERIEQRSLLVRAAERFSLSARELDVLELLLAGESTPSVATMLAIAEPTARDHIKRLLSKTGARNRVEVAARFFGFQPRIDATRYRRRSA